jgi:hypothetical protein
LRETPTSSTSSLPSTISKNIDLLSIEAMIDIIPSYFVPNYSQNFSSNFNKIVQFFIETGSFKI